MGKYIIESKFENTRCFLEVACENREPYFFINRVDSLTPYTEPDLHEVRKKAYEKGYHDAAYNCHEGCNFLDDAKKKADEEYRRGYADGEAHCKTMVQDFGTIEGADAYQRGLADAWEAVKKLARMDTDTSESITGYFGLHNIMHNLTASEVIEEIRAYEQAQKEKEEQIQVGDEVATDAGNRASVLYENPDGTQVFVFKSDGTAAWWTKSALHRTGRNFFEIATVLEKMREGQE